jgi:phosphoribosylpyrophosphate synthetase
MIAPPSMLVDIILTDTTVLKSPTLAVDAVKVIDVFNILQKAIFYVT